MTLCFKKLIPSWIFFPWSIYFCFSSVTPVFPSLHQKPTFANSNSTWNQVDEEALRGCTTPKSLFLWFCFILFVRVFVLYDHCSFQPKIKLTLADLGGSEQEIVILSSVDSSYKLPFLSLVTCSRLINAWDLSCLGYVILHALAKKKKNKRKKKNKEEMQDKSRLLFQYLYKVSILCSLLADVLWGSFVTHRMRTPKDVCEEAKSYGDKS